MCRLKLDGPAKDLLHCVQIKSFSPTFTVSLDGATSWLLADKVVVVLSTCKVGVVLSTCTNNPASSAITAVSVTSEGASAWEDSGNESEEVLPMVSPLVVGLAVSISNCKCSVFRVSMG